MTSIEELIAKHCPDGVEFKKLKEVTILDGINQIGASELSFYNKGKGNIKLLPSSADYDCFCDENDDNKNYIINDCVITLGRARYSNIKYWNGKFISSNNHIVRSIDKTYLDTKFLFHFLNRDAKNFYTETGCYPKFTRSEYENYEIPIPPLAVQQEIVRILDTFSSLTAELTAELKLRRKQYEYYRDELLTFGEEVEWKTLGEVCKIKNGSDYKKLSAGEYPVYGSGGIMTFVNKYVYDRPSVLIPRKGSLSNLFYVDKPFWNVDTIFYTEIFKDVIIPKYLYFYLQKSHLEQYNIAGGVPSLTQSVLNKHPIPLPPLNIQQQIVSILDKFDTYCNDLTQGLPKEIELRKKQYEYYRDLLLTFRPLTK